MECKMCGGECGFMGSLGPKLWFRCINCGADQSFSPEDEQPLQDNEDDDDDWQDDHDDERESAAGWR